jgi:protein-S-isoprenylcysteine O-methyltransferase Ste14
MKSSFLSHLRAILVLPFTGIVIIPAVILLFTGSAVGVWGWDYPFGIIQIILGGPIILLGLYLLYSTIRLFVVIGRGTLAPWEPPRKLVITGIYGYVRNPMISGVLVALFGEAVLFGSIAVFVWCATFFIANGVYFRFLEEPGLVRRFGGDYVEYRRNVPTWLPRLRPWNRD